MDEYYLNSVETCSWPGLYYGNFSEIINENNYKIVAEIGCGYGLHSKYVLNTTNISKLYMIDPYTYYGEDGFSKGINDVNIPNVTTQEKFDMFFNLVKKNILDEKVEFIRDTSINSSKQIEDNSLDAIFIDGDHSYQSVLEDLFAWWPKVKSGGALVGDDYWIEDVQKAVHFFERYFNLEVQFKIKAGTDYKTFYFIK
jgi:cephalosporin hydroxylase